MRILSASDWVKYGAFKAFEAACVHTAQWGINEVVGNAKQKMANRVYQKQNEESRLTRVEKSIESLREDIRNIKNK